MIIAASVLLVLAIGAGTVFAAEYFKCKKNGENLSVLLKEFSSIISKYANEEIVETKTHFRREQ